jgi:hypothetical protein
MEVRVKDEREKALEEFLRVFDERLGAGPIVDRRGPERRQPADKLIDARRAGGPVDGDLAYWVLPEDSTTRH